MSDSYTLEIRAEDQSLFDVYCMPRSGDTELLVTYDKDNDEVQFVCPDVSLECFNRIGKLLNAQFGKQSDQALQSETAEVCATSNWD